MTAPVADVLGDIDLDRSPACEVLFGSVGAVGLTFRPCNQEAAWVAVIPCCGRFSLLCCCGHRASPAPWSCRRCGAAVPDEEIGWVRL